MLTRSGARATLENRLQTLQTQILTLGSLVSEAILFSSKVLHQQNVTGAKTLILADKEINEKRVDIQKNCLRIIATQNPIAGDLRFVSACLEIASELERMHDYAKGIAKVTLIIGEERSIIIPPGLSQMAKETHNMLYLSMDALIQRNVGLARSVAITDDQIDLLYEQVYHELIDPVHPQSTLSNHAHHLLWVAHNLERTGDRVTNICEWVVYIATGQRVEMNVDGDIPLNDF